MEIDSQIFNFLMHFFNNGKKENPRFFRRLENPDIRGCNILEVGCGTGSLAIYMVKELGAKKVTAIDIEETNIEFAQANLAHNYPELVGRVEYRPQLLTELSLEETFDCVVSKDSFEHIMDFSKIFNSMRDHLNSGGRILAGFGPLWESCKGGHALTVFPFDHLFLSKNFVLSRYNRKKGTHLKSVYEYGLNMLKLKDYLPVFDQCGMKQNYLRLNLSDKAIGILFARTLLKLPFFRRFTFNAYLIFTKV